MSNAEGRITILPDAQQARFKLYNQKTKNERKNYYENNKDKVNEPEKLKQRARELYKSISDAKKMFEGVENG